MESERGFLLMNALILAFFISLAAALGYRFLSTALRNSSFSENLLMSSGAADYAVALRKLSDRSILNPLGLKDPACSFENAINLSNRNFKTIIQKEVVTECPGLSRWIVIARPEKHTGNVSQKGEVRHLVGSFDPF